MAEEIGRVIGTERRPNTAYTFYFWTDTRASVGIGSLVKVKADDPETIVYGVVVEVHGFNDLESPLHEFLSVGGEPGVEPPTLRPEMRVYQAAVLRREPEEPIGAVPIGRVFTADEADVQRALRCDGYRDEHGIPCGAYGSAKDPVAVYLHSRFLLGPEAGHLNITGTSGLAAKTSYILFLLKAIFEHHRDMENDAGDKGVAALLFNTKGGDLLYIDRSPDECPGANALTEEQLDNYRACGVTPKPFEKVRYYAPYAKDAVNLNTLRRNEELEALNRTRPFSFGLKDIVKHAEVLLNRDDLDAKADAYLQYLNDRFIEGDGHQIGKKGELRKAESLKELTDIIQEQLRDAEQNNQSQIESHSALTVRKMYNRLYNLGGRFGGLVAEKGGHTGPFDEPFEPGTIYVIDVSGLDSESQDLVFAAFITQLKELMEAQQLGVGHLVVMVDELNKYAPSGSAETYVVKALKEIASRGRYLGLTLFGAQQFRSRIDKEIVGNAATHAFGHIEAEELAQPGYSYFTPAVKEKLGSLSPGEILIKHPHFAQPVFLRFPPPSCLKGQDGMRRYKREEEKPLYDVLCGELKRFALPYNVSKGMLDSLSDERLNLLRLLRELRALKDSDDPTFVLQKGTRAAPVRREPKLTIEEYDPFVN